MPLSRPIPQFFEAVRRKAHQRWDQLEADAELLGPWKLLFAQVQSPRHVLSELLQNADDAGATTATAQIEGDLFTFSHTGDDFSEKEFESLCRFGFSNKRMLHTIGFRGIGFKSIFSLGDSVEVCTPQLAVRFDKRRFTEPIWIADAPLCHATYIRVRMRDSFCKRELLENIREWKESPVSLLFFRNLKRLTLEGQTFVKDSAGTGPFPGSESLYLKEDEREKHSLILVRSEELPFPEDVIREISRERDTSDLNLQSCRVELVLKLSGAQQLYVVLPAGVRPDLPFSCNAPFLQDPARSGIKDPATSPTNRWLLEQIGRLAGQSFVAWLQDTEFTVAQRTHAYSLIPPPPSASSNDVAADCRNLVSTGFDQATVDAPVLLSVDGQVLPENTCLALPADIHRTWTDADALAIFGTGCTALLAEQISNADRQVLEKWNWLRRITDADVLTRLRSDPAPPRPKDWSGLVRLWTYLHAHTRDDFSGSVRKSLKIVPVAGSQQLHAATGVARPSSQRQNISDADWQFLASRIAVIDDEWLGFLDRQGKQKTGEPAPSLGAALDLLHALGLRETTPWDRVITQANSALLNQPEVPLEELIRLTSIMAAIGVQAPQEVQYVTRDLYRRGREVQTIFDPAGRVETLVPESWANGHLLHSDYYSGFTPASRSQWESWAASEKSRLAGHLSPIAMKAKLPGKGKLRTFLINRGVENPKSFPYRSDDFEVDDFDFPEALIQHWQRVASSDPDVWCRVVQELCADPRQGWATKAKATLRQNGYSYTKTVPTETIPAAWVVRLRQLRCLRDTYGNLHEPAELLMRTPDTEALMGVELFVRAEEDTEATKPLLRLLGVRDTPSNPQRLLDRIRALSNAPRPPIHEVAKWYDALDRVLLRSRPDDLQQAREAFASGRLMLTEQGEWASLGEVYLDADPNEIGEVPLVHSSVRQLALWRRLGVAERPSPELVVAWLGKLAPGVRLDAEMQARVKATLKRYPARIWHDCQHWLSLDGTWAPTAELPYQVSMQGLTRYADLFPAFKARTADLRMLNAETCERPPFATLTNLGAVIEYRIGQQQHDLPSPTAKPWLRALGEGLSRVKLPDEKHTQSVRNAAARLARTVWQPFHQLRVIPYIEGTPAGDSHSPHVLWHEHTLYVHQLPLSKVFNSLVSELARAFARKSVEDAVRVCAERDAAFVNDYLEENFELASPTEATTREQAATDTGNGNASHAAGDQNPAAEAKMVAVEAGVETAGQNATGVESSNGDAAGETVDVGGLGSEASTDEQPSADDLPTRPTREREPRSPAEPTLIARFALARGFRWSAELQRFVHCSGNYLQKSSGTGFNWEQFTPGGDVQCRYWVAEQSLFSGAVELAADLWELIKQAPTATGLVLVGENGEPQEILGVELVRRINEKWLELFPAKYRLRQCDE